MLCPCSIVLCPQMFSLHSLSFIFFVLHTLLPLFYLPTLHALLDCTLICTLSQQISDMFALQLQISLSLLCRHYSRSMLHTASDYYRLHSVDSGLCVSSLSCSCQSCPCLTPPGPRSFPSIASRAPARSVGPAKSRCVPFIPRKLT